MELIASEERTKGILKQVFSELLEEKRDLFTEITSKKQIHCRTS